MSSPPFKTVHASVRPPRVVVFVDKADTDWQHTCLRIIEFYSRLWGGAYNIIIPTDGKSIDQRFWAILETFDPDYLFRYHKSGEDLFRSHPEEYEEIFGKYAEAALRDGSTDQQAIRTRVDKSLRDSWLTSEFEISQPLQQELKARLSPFWLEHWVVDAGAISAGVSPPFHLTDLLKIILSTEHPNRFASIEAPSEVSKIWFSAVTGAFDQSTRETLQQLGIENATFSFRDDNLSQLIELTVTGGIRQSRMVTPDRPTFWDLDGITPFQISMLQLGLYRSTRYRDWEQPLILVAGNTFEDFSLYYCLSRIRDRVIWVLPSLTDKALSVGSTYTLSRSEINFIFQISSAERSPRHSGGTRCISYSLRPDEVERVIQELSSLSARQYASQIQQLSDVDSLIRSPLVAIERDNFHRDVALQMSGDVTLSPFNTPKPKHFPTIHPYEHRYITQLSVAGHAPPKHHDLGTWTIVDQRLTTDEARVGAEGPAYFCPNIAYFGGDIDTVLVRPRLHLPSLSTILEKLARDRGFECRPSDKGIYADESLSKWGGLKEISNFLRMPENRALMDKFLDDSGSAAGQGVYLDDKRRYLDFQTIYRNVGDVATALIDELISKQILYRGFIFGCSFCRNAAWFSVSDITQEFKCRRCGRQQVYTKRNWKQPDEPAWYYKLDELIYLGYRNGMAVSLLTLDYMRRKSEQNFSFTTDREFWMPKKSKAEVEADLFCVADGILTIGEAKKENKLGNSASEEAAKIRKYKQLVNGLVARQLIFATLSAAWHSGTVEAIKAAFADLKFVKLVFLDASHLL